MSHALAGITPLLAPDRGTASPYKTKAGRKQFDDQEMSCPIAPDEATGERVKLRRRVGVFTGKNRREYTGWKKRLVAHLVLLKLDQVLKRTPPEVRGLGGRKDGAYQERCEQDCEVIDEICTTIEGAPLDQVAGWETSRKLQD
ncbi:hypothetical protein pipiens_010710 [Culex pipiens pipiens]|uniref:Uncharacterized protein n=1 Tax=Culex pipiens pipiens TaxID=38569 RepID=A0ABD1DAR3_CULPP